MDYASIATLTITALSPFVKKGVEKIVEKSAENAFTERQAIWDKVKNIFKQDDLTMLNLLQDAELSDNAKGRLEGKLETYLEANPEIAKELEELIKKLPAPGARQFTLTQEGNENIGIQGIEGSKIIINK